MTDQILARARVPALSDSTALAVDCAKYLQLLLVATDMGQHSADLKPSYVHAILGFGGFRQAEIRNTLRIAGLIHFDWYGDGYRLALGDGR